MVAPELGTFGISGSVYPLTRDTSHSLLQDADTPLYRLLDYFASQLEFYAGARWRAEVARAGNTAMPNIVGSKFPNNPFPYLQDTSIKFPLLAIYRVDGKMRELTMSYDRVQSHIEIAWVMSPLSMGEIEIFGGPMKNVVLDIIADRSNVPSDPNYQDGYNWGQAAAFDWLQVSDYTMMMVPHITAQLPMEAVVLKLTLTERSMPVADTFEPLTGIDTEIDLVNDPNDTPPDIMDNFIDTKNDF